MNFLAFDTTRENLIAVSMIDSVFNGKVYSGGFHHSNSLMPAIHDILGNGKLANIDVIGVNTGPGSFTGIRIGISTAKGLSFVTKRKIVAVNSFELASFNLSETPPKFLAVVLTDEKTIYWSVINTLDLSYAVAPSAVDHDELQFYIDNHNEFEAITGTDGLDFVIPSEIKVFKQFKKPTRSLARLIDYKIRHGQFTTAESLQPTYYQLSQAERARLEAERQQRIRETEERTRREAEQEARRREEERRREESLNPATATAESIGISGLSNGEMLALCTKAISERNSQSRDAKRKTQDRKINSLKRSAVLRVMNEGGKVEEYRGVMDEEMYQFAILAENEIYIIKIIDDLQNLSNQLKSGTFTGVFTGEDMSNTQSSDSIMQDILNMQSNDDNSQATFEMPPLDGDNSQATFEMPPLDGDNSHASFEMPPLDGDNSHASFEMPPLDGDNSHASFEMPPLDGDNSQATFEMPPLDGDNSHASFEMPPLEDSLEQSSQQASDTKDGENVEPSTEDGISEDFNIEENSNEDANIEGDNSSNDLGEEEGQSNAEDESVAEVDPFASLDFDNLDFDNIDFSNLDNKED